MAKFTRHQVIEKIQDTGLVPLFYHRDVQLSKNVLKACYDGGARIIEFTHRGDLAHEVFRELIEFTDKKLPEMILGVGSLTDASQASHYLNNGANFIVTPVLREDIAILCNRRKVLWTAGCGSLTEIARCEELGAEIVKLFPGNVYGPEFIKAIKGPQPWTSIMPTGGVTTQKENLITWFEAGATCVGMGSKLITKDLLHSRDFVKLTKAVREVLAIIQTLK